MVNPDGAEADTRRNARRRRPEPRPHRARAARDAGAPPGRAAPAAARGRGLPRVHAATPRSGASAGGSPGPTSRWTGSTTRSSIPAVVPPRRRWVDESARAEAAGGPPVPALLGRRPAAGRGAAALGPGHRRRAQRHRDVRRPFLHHRGRGQALGQRPVRRPRQPGRRLPGPVPAVPRRRRPPAGGPRGDRARAGTGRCRRSSRPTTCGSTSGAKVTRVPGDRGGHRPHAPDPDREHDDRRWRSSGACRRRSATRSSPARRQDFRALLERHGIPYEELDRAAHGHGRDVHARCASRRSSTTSTAATRGGRSCTAGQPRRARARARSLWVPLEGEAALRAALVLEPAAMYGALPVPALQGAGGAGRRPCRCCAS